MNVKSSKNNMKQQQHKRKTSSAIGSAGLFMNSDFDDRQQRAAAMISDSGQDEARLGGNVRVGGLELRETDFDQEQRQQQEGDNFLYRRRLDNSRTEQQNMSIYREAEQDLLMEYQKMMRVTTAATGQSDNNKGGGTTTTSTAKGKKKKNGANKSSTTFMGSIEDDDAAIIHRFQEEQEFAMTGRQPLKKKVEQVMVATEDEWPETENPRQISKKSGGAAAPGKKKKKKKVAPPTREEERRYRQYQEQEDETDEVGGFEVNYPRGGGGQNFEQFSENFFPNTRYGQGRQMPAPGGISMRSRQVFFEPQFITHQPMMLGASSSQRGGLMRPNQRIMALPSSQMVQQQQEYPDEREKWVSKATQQGFLYFHLKGTKTYQWNFPRFYDPDIKKTRPYFVDHWVKKYDNRGKKYWQNMHSKHIQHVKPDSETYLIQASIAGNLAFIELYVKSQGNLVINDQQKRTALHHAVSNGNREITAMLCEFSYPLIESKDINGCTPVFMATRYNETECLKLLISYDCNIFHKMRNGDTCLHVASAYNSLESMILLTNFGGMELFLQRNRYGLRAIDIAKKMRNYECFEVLQKLERNVQYQNAILEREIQSLDQYGASGARGGAGSKSMRTGRAEYLGSGSNYPALSSRRQMMEQAQPRSHRRRAVVPTLQLNSLREHQLQQDSADSSFMDDEEPDQRDFHFGEEEDDEEGAHAFESLGGRTGYQQRINDFERQADVMKHERRYLNKVKAEKALVREDARKRSRHKIELEFDDHRKQMRREKVETAGKENATGARSGQQKKGAQIESETSSPEDVYRRRERGRIGGGPPHQQVTTETETEVEPFRGVPPPTYEPRSHRRQASHRNHDVSQRNQSAFKLSIRDDDNEFRELGMQSSSAARRGPGGAQSHRNKSARVSREGGGWSSRRDHQGYGHESQRFLQRHLAHRYTDDESVDEDARIKGQMSSRRRKKGQIASSSMGGDAWRVSRSRDRRERQPSQRRSYEREGRSGEEEEEQKTYAALAYDKTSAFVSTVKGFFANGLSKLKSFMQSKTARSRTRSKSQRSSRNNNHRISEEDSSSMERYKTPLGGRSKSRGALSLRAGGTVAIQPAPQTTTTDGAISDEQMQDDGVSRGIMNREDSRRRHVNFGRVVAVQPALEVTPTSTTENDDHRQGTRLATQDYVPQGTVGISSQFMLQHNRQKSMISTGSRSSLHQRSQFVPSFVQAVEPPPQINLVKSALKRTSSVAPAEMVQQPTGTTAVALIQSMEFDKSNDQLQQQNQQPGASLANHKKKKSLGNVKAVLVRKNYQSSEERGGGGVGELSRWRKDVEGGQWQELSASSRSNTPGARLGHQKTRTEVPQYQPINIIRQSGPATLESGSPFKTALPPPAAGASQHKKSVSAEPVQQQTSPSRPQPVSASKRISQEQFDMIMLHSEQENCPPAVSMTPTAVPQAKVAGRQPEKLSSKEQQVEKEEEVKVEVVKTDDIQRFYDDLMKQTLIPSAVSGASGGSGNNNEILKETLDESNLSAMYQRIMKENEQFLPPQQRTKLSESKPQVAVAQQQVAEQSIVLTEFDPPTQKLGISMQQQQYKVGESFQSGITDLRLALEEEENLEQVSDCSFLADEESAKKINEQIAAAAASNILDKGVYLSQLQQQNMTNNSQIHQKQSSQPGSGDKPLGSLNMLLKQNNSMHFKGWMGGGGQPGNHSFNKQYQSDNDELLAGKNTKGLLAPLMNRKGSVAGQQDMTTPERPHTAKNIIPNPSSIRGSQQINNADLVSATKNAEVVEQVHQSDNTSCSNVVVIKSSTTNSQMTRYHIGQEQQQHPLKEVQVNLQQKMIDLFKEDAMHGVALVTPLLVDETQTDLESGVKSRPTAPLDSLSKRDQGLFQGVEANNSDTQHLLPSPMASTVNKPGEVVLLLETSGSYDQPGANVAQGESERLKDENLIRKKLIEIIVDEDDVQVELNRHDDQTQQAASVEYDQNHKGAATQRDEEQEETKLAPLDEARRRQMQAKKGNTRYSEVPKTFMDQLNQQHDDSSMINFDLSQSKIITEHHHQQQQLKAGNNPLTRTVIESESHNNTNMSNTTSSGAMIQIKKKQLISDMEAEVLSLVKLPPFVGQSEEFKSQIEPEIQIEEVAKRKPRIVRHYILREVKKKTSSAAAFKEQQSQDSILNELDSISQIYNNLEPTATVDQLEEIKQDQNNSGSGKKRQAFVASAWSPKRQGSGIQDSPVITSSKHLTKLPPMILQQSSQIFQGVASEDEGVAGGDFSSRGGGGVADIFYPKQAAQHQNTPSNKQAENVSNSSFRNANNYLQWMREDKQNKSTAVPLFSSYNTSSDDDGTATKKLANTLKKVRLLNKYATQQHQTDNQVSQFQPIEEVAGSIAQPDEAPPMKTATDAQKQTSAAPANNNVSSLTDTGSRLKESLKMFSKNRLLGSTSSKLSKHKSDKK